MQPPLRVDQRDLSMKGVRVLNQNLLIYVGMPAVDEGQGFLNSLMDR